jgi:aprataxin and PNK-like factor
VKTWEDVCENAKTKKPFSQLEKKKSDLQKHHSVLFSTVPSRDPETGRKEVTDDDTDKIGEAPNPSVAAKEPCKYGTSCYQVNPAHLARFLHPPKPQASTTPQEAKKVPTATTEDKEKKSEKKQLCKWGSHCYRTDPAHKEKYSHPEKTEELDPTLPLKEESDDEKDVDPKNDENDESLVSFQVFFCCLYSFN